jgi:hypothetical protein
MEKSTGKEHQQIEIREERPLQTATPGIENQQVSLQEGKLSEQATRPDESFGQQETRHADPVQHLNGALPAMRPDSSDGGNTYDTLSSPADIHNSSIRVQRSCITVCRATSSSFHQSCMA